MAALALDDFNVDHLVITVLPLASSLATVRWLSSPHRAVEPPPARGPTPGAEGSRSVGALVVATPARP